MMRKSVCSVWLAVASVVSLCGCGGPVDGADPAGQGAMDLGGTTEAVTTLKPWKAGAAYAVGDEVTFNGLTFRTRQAHRAQVGWEPPNVYALWERRVAAGVWAPQVIYRGTEVGNPEIVAFLGHQYRLRQGHQALAGWEPPNVPALWALIK